jgi:hypothetical protein
LLLERFEDFKMADSSVTPETTTLEKTLAATKSSELLPEEIDTSEEASDEVMEKITLPPPAAISDSKPLQLLNFIYLNLSEAQKMKGRFTLSDCKNITIAYQLLEKFLNERSSFEKKRLATGVEPEKVVEPKVEKVEVAVEEKAAAEEKVENKEPLADEMIMGFYNIILAGVEMQQETGAYTISGAAQLLDALLALERFLTSVKSPVVVSQDQKPLNRHERRQEERKAKQDKKKQAKKSHAKKGK